MPIRTSAAVVWGHRVALIGVLLTATILAIASPAHAATVKTCARFGTVSINGNRYIYQQDEWNSQLRQCASVDNVTGAWALTRASFNLAPQGAPATYPSTFRGCHWGLCTTASGLPIQVSKLGTATSSWSAKQVSSGAYNVTYDLWTNSTPSTPGAPDGSEIMIWLANRGGPRPFGTFRGTVDLAGASWNVYTGRQSGSGWNTISYLRTTPTFAVTNLDLRAFIADSVSWGSTQASWYLLDAEAGFEIWQGGKGLGTNSFSFTATADTAAPTRPTNLQVTETTSSSVSLSWDPSTDDVAVAGYTVFRDGVAVGTTDSTSFTDIGLQPSTPYSYTVGAFDAAGNHSVVSDPAIAITQPSSPI
jgi:hypothetical protein